MVPKKAEAQPSFTVDVQTLENYETGLPAPDGFDTETPLSGSSEILFARSSDAKNDPVSFVIKKQPKTGGKPSPFYVAEKYLAQNAPVKSSAIVFPVSFFEDDIATYVVYPLPKGQRLIHYGKIDTDDTRKKLAIQFLSLLRSLHKQGVLYLKVVHDNVFFNDRGKLSVLGFDSGAIIPGGPIDAPADGKKKSSSAERFTSPSQFTKWSTQLIPELDWLSLGTFICRLFQSDAPFADGAKAPDASKVHCSKRDLVLKLLDVAQSVQDGYDPRKEDFLKPVVNVELLETKFVFNDFHVDWSDGILVGYGDTDVGFRVSDSQVFITGEGCELSLGAQGLKLTDNSRSWVTPEITVGPSGVTLERGSRKIELGPSGLTWGGGFLGKLSLGPSGVEISIGSDRLAIMDGKLDIAFSGSQKPKQSFEGGNVVIDMPYTNRLMLGKSGLLIQNMYQYLSLGPEGLKMHLCNLDFNILISPPSLFMQAGAASLSLSADGLDITLADNSFHAGGDGVVFAAEGLTLTVNANGVNLENDNPEVDLSAYAMPKLSLKFKPPKLDMPPLPPLPKPPMPGIPSLPSIPKMPSFGGSKEKEGKVDDFLNAGETVKEQADIVRRRKLFLKKTVHLIRTSTDRLFFCSELYGEKRGDDLVLGKSSTVEPLKDNTIKIKTADGKEVALTFKNLADRAPWIAKLQEIIQGLT
jgi:hypothetical protein